MHLLLTGGTGLIGRALCAALLAEGHRITVLSRRPDKVTALCGRQVIALGSLEDVTDDLLFDAVINLAGAPIVDLPWTARRKRTLWDSRVTLTERLVASLARSAHPPRCLISGSAVGYYGNQGDTVCEDHGARGPGTDFGSQLCAAWEAAAIAATPHGIRVCLLRTGLLLAAEGGLLARMRTPFALGLGARLGDGQQWMSWIHIDDYVTAVLTLLRDEAAHGAYNLTAPTPVRNAEFTTTLAQALKRPAFLRAPACLLRAAFGQRADFFLGGQQALPTRLQQAGFSFRHPTLTSALKALL